VSSNRADGARRAGMREVAERAGVALSSVSRVLSGHPDVSEVMRNRVRDAVAALGYEPDMLAQSMRTGATMTVGFVVSDISNPLFAQIGLGAEVRLRASGYALQLANSMSRPELDARHVRLFRSRRVDGLLLSLADEDDGEAVGAVAASGIPCVLVDREAPELAEMSAVLSDHAAGMTEAVGHLLELGHQRIALINGNPHVRPGKERAKVLRRLTRGRPDVTAQLRQGSFTAEHGEATSIELLSQPHRPTAIIVGGNQILAGVLRGIRAAGLRVPSDLSLITCDDVPLAEFLEPPIATVSRKPGEIGRVAAELLLDRMAGAEPRRVTLPTGFRATDSCAKPSS
jgi:LacI family transcriptional regulator, galactose operon repressor